MTWKTHDIWLHESIMWNTRTQLYKTHNSSKIGMNSITGVIVISKAIHFIDSEIVRPLFILRAQIPESFNE